MTPTSRDLRWERFLRAANRLVLGLVEVFQLLPGVSFDCLCRLQNEVNSQSLEAMQDYGRLRCRLPRSTCSIPRQIVILNDGQTIQQSPALAQLRCEGHD